MSNATPRRRAGARKRVSGAKTRRKYWIRFHWSECVLCGQTENSRERVYEDVEPKPPDKLNRHNWGPAWACPSHFL